MLIFLHAIKVLLLIFDIYETLAAQACSTLQELDSRNLISADPVYLDHKRLRITDTELK